MSWLISKLRYSKTTIEYEEKAPGDDNNSDNEYQEPASESEKGDDSDGKVMDSEEKVKDESAEEDAKVEENHKKVKDESVEEEQVEVKKEKKKKAKKAKKNGGKKKSKKSKKTYKEEDVEYVDEELLKKNEIEEEEEKDETFEGEEYIQDQMGGVNDNKSIGSKLGSIVSQTRLGTDLLTSGISLPASFYEPLSVLQRQAEMLEYSQLLDKAAECEDTIDRMVYIAALGISSLSGTQRFHNNFNPIIGETYEYIDEKRGWRSFSEQVSHHPPVSATHAEKDNLWTYYQNSCPTTGFLGNAIALDTQGKSHVSFPQSKDHFYYTNPKTRIHNVLFGKMWIEHHGELNVRNLKNGYTCVINFKKCGLFGRGADYNFEGTVKDSDNNICVEITGKWNEYAQAKWLVDTKDSAKGKVKEIWRIYDKNFSSDKFHLSRYTKTLTEINDEMRKIIPPTDSRLRLDNVQLQSGNLDYATKLKKIMEERQRQDKKKRESEGEEWVPQFFHNIPDEEGGSIWVYCGDYWEQRDKKVKRLKEGKSVKKLLDGGTSKGTSTDFLSYDLEKI